MCDGNKNKKKNSHAYKYMKDLVNKVQYVKICCAMILNIFPCIYVFVCKIFIKLSNI